MMMEKEAVEFILEEIHSMRRQMEEYEDHVQYLENELIDLKSQDSLASKNSKQASASKGSLTGATGPVEKPIEDADDVDDEEEEPYETPEDIYTLMYFSPVMSTAFLYGLFIFVLQILIISLIISDLLVDDLPEGFDDGNKFNVPVEETTTVRIAQIIAIVISVASRDDVTDTIDLLAFGPKKGVKDLFPGATRSKFYFVNILRLLQGTYVILVSFTFIVQADNVLDLFLNFAAIEFVAGLDNLAWDLAASGWVLTSMQESIQTIRETEIMITSEDKNRMLFHPSMAKTAFFLALIGGLIVGWFQIYQLQKNGSLLEATGCGMIEVHFGDQVLDFNSSGYREFETFSVPSIYTDRWNVTRIVGSKRTLGSHFDITDLPDLTYSSFSGNYEAFYDPLVNGRPVYYERGFNDPTSGKFYYCDSEQAWAFTIEALAAAGAIPEATIVRCGRDGALLISSQTQSYSLDEVPLDGWKIWTGSLDDTEDFTFSCAECNSDVDCGITHGTCGDDNVCHCSREYVGNFCNDDRPCEELALYFEREDPYTMNIPSNFSVRANDRWIYVHPLGEYLGEEYFEFVFYNGRRWYDAFFTADEIFIYFDPASGQEDLSIFELFSLGFHSYWSGVLRQNVYFFSEPTDTYVPIGPLQWYEIKDSRSVGTQGLFGYIVEVQQQIECVSVDCSVDGICGLYGNCTHEDTIILGEGVLPTNASGNVCLCEGNFTGHFCEYKNVLQTDQEGNVIAVDDIDPFLGACNGPFSWLPDCVFTLYEEFWEY